jgi:hypothetical protein
MVARETPSPGRRRKNGGGDAEAGAAPVSQDALRALTPAMTAALAQVGAITHVASVKHYFTCICYQKLVCLSAAHR